MRGFVLALIFELSAFPVVAQTLSDVQRAQPFTAQLFNLHEKAIASDKLSQTVTEGRYEGEMAKSYSYREIIYKSIGSGATVSRVRWDSDRSGVLDELAVNVLDDRGRIVRDYQVIYLPWMLSVPVRTFINLHAYDGGLHSYRQFDASGARIYEQCRGTLGKEKVDLSLEAEDIKPVANTPAYRACFAGLPATPGIYLTPQ